MTEVVIAGIGQTQVSEHWERSLRSLAVESIQDALKDSGGLNPQSLFVGNVLAPNLSNQAHLGALIAIDYAAYARYRGKLTMKQPNGEA
jgi:acetyl-CoA C-acetyltransferase